MSSDDEFAPTESTDKAEDEQFLNKKTGEYVPQMFVKTFLTLGVAIGFIIGFTIMVLIISGGMCVLNTITAFTGNPAAGNVGEDFTENIQSELKQCTKSNITSPISIIAGVVTGSITAYPAYNMVKSLSSGNYLRSII